MKADPLRGIGEVIIEFIDSFVHGVIEDHHYRALVPFFGSLFMFILTANFFGLIPGHGAADRGLRPDLRAGHDLFRLLHLPGLPLQRRVVSAKLPRPGVCFWRR